MALNPFFLNGSKTEQGLVQDLINESLRMYGVEVHYMPRSYLKKNTVIQEVIQSEFKNAYPIEAYVDNYEGYGGQRTILSKFGIEERDDLTLVISQERFSNYIALLTEDLPNMELTTRPKEGDLIYFPLGDKLFEIKYVEHEQPFYQLQKNYVYTLTCELFRYEDEVIDTNIDTIDDEIAQIGYIQTLDLIGIGTTAVAETTYCPSGAVQKVYITNMGNDYTSMPTVSFTSSPGRTATGIASLTGNYIGCTGVKGNKVQAVNLINPGCGYTVEPWVVINGGGGAGAAATAGICTMGSVGIVTITGGGSGYSTNPPVYFPPLNGYMPAGFQTAYGYGQVNTTGVVTAVYIIDAGCGYTAAPSVNIANPGYASTLSGIGTTSFIFNEIVVGSISSTSSRVKEWNAVTNKLEISIVSGTYQRGELIVGQESGAKYMVGGLQEFDEVDGFADNDTIETKGDLIVDFSETNPFGMP